MILHEVITTEKVPFHYRVAGLGSRFLAWLVDLVVLALLLVVGACLASPLEAGRRGAGGAFMAFWIFGLQWGYFLLFEWLWNGQTPGKRVLGIRVIDWRGTRVTFLQSAIRNFLRAGDGLPIPFFFYGLGFAVAACNREQRRLGDLLAGTLVVHIDARARPIQALHERAEESLHLSETLVRQRLGRLNRQQKQTLLDLCLRRDQLRVADRARLFRATAEFCEKQLDLAPDQYQSDEKFVLLVASVLGESGPPEAEPVRRPALAGRKERRP
jgi:uncharacterized RDD family membrane protein YckC